MQKKSSCPCLKQKLRPVPMGSSQFARVVKGVDLRSTAGNCAWVRTPQLTFRGIAGFASAPLDRSEAGGLHKQPLELQLRLLRTSSQTAPQNTTSTIGMRDSVSAVLMCGPALIDKPKETGMQICLALNIYLASLAKAPPVCHAFLASAKPCLCRATAAAAAWP